MRTTDFSRVLFDALQFSGNDRHNINAETFSQFRDFSNFRLREAWEMFQWSDICRLQAFTTTTSSDVTFFVPNALAGEILGVFSRNPQTSTKAIDLMYQLYNDNGTEKVILNENIAEGWYFYRLECPVLSGDLYDSTIPYYEGSQIYFDSGSGTGTYSPVLGKPHQGNFYTCTVSSTTAGQNPLTHPSYWSVIDIPYVFGPYLSWGSTSNWFVSEGMIQEAAVIEAKAKEMLENEFDKITRQQGQVSRINMIKTY